MILFSIFIWKIAAGIIKFDDIIKLLKYVNENKPISLKYIVMLKYSLIISFDRK
jgi:hypothetical protein